MQPVPDLPFSLPSYSLGPRGKGGLAHSRAIFSFYNLKCL